MRYLVTFYGRSILKAEFEVDANSAEEAEQKAYEEDIYQFSQEIGFNGWDLVDVTCQ